MKGDYRIPKENISEYVENILVIENKDVVQPFSLPLFANGTPTLLFQTVKGEINNSANYLTLFGQTIFPEQITITENFTLIAYFFKPFAITKLFGCPAKDLTDNPIDLSLIAPKQSLKLQTQLLESSTTDKMIEYLNKFIFSLINSVQTDPKLIKYASSLIANSPSNNILREVQNELHMTERTFQRMFKNEIGISPNQYRRIAQFSAAFRQLQQRQFGYLSDIGFDNNYADQSHFIRSFREFTGMNPKEYLELAKSNKN